MSKIPSGQIIEYDPAILEAILDSERIKREYLTWEQEGDAYIDRRFTDLRDWDFPAWAAINIRITTKAGGRVPLFLNRAQLKLTEIILEELTAGKPVRIIVVKDRQVGVSTDVLYFFYWLISLRANHNAIVITQDSESVFNFSSRIRASMDDANPLLTPMAKSERRDVIHFASPTGRNVRNQRYGAGQDSRMLFMTCKKPNIGRSYTCQYALLSEVAFYNEMKPKVSLKKLLSSLAHAIPSLPGTIVLMETTPNGLNEVAEIYGKALRGENEWRPVFISSIASDEYRAVVPDGETLELCQSEEIGGLSTRWGNELAESRIIRQQLVDWYPERYKAGGDEWLGRETMARLNWRRRYIDGPCGGDKRVFRREFALTPAQGFESTGKNCFDLPSIELMRQFVEEESLPAKRFAYVHDPEDADPESKFKADSYGPLTIYEDPQRGSQYILVGDPAQGVKNGDRSGLLLLACAEEPPYLREVASYSEIITPDKFAELLYYLGTLYNTALLAPERNERGGFAVCLKLHKEMNYENLFFRSKNYGKAYDDQPGFVTEGSNKGVIVTGLDYRIREGDILLRSPALLSELEHYVELETGELGAEPGYSDDLAMCAMIGANVSLRIQHWRPRETPPPGSIGDMKKKGIWKKR